MNEAEARQAVIAEARSWIGTPYHHMAQVKGAGVDCAMFPAAVYAAAGVIAPPAIEFYPPDWHLHRGAERYLERVVAYAAEIDAPEPGDFVLWRIGRAFAHGAIAIAWPRIVHPVVGIGVIEDDGESPTLAFGRPREGRRPRRFFSPWRKAHS